MLLAVCLLFVATGCEIKVALCAVRVGRVGNLEACSFIVLPPSTRQGIARGNTMPQFSAVLLALLQLAHGDVLCGNHRAETCAQCPITATGASNGAGWCNGVCIWDSATNRCMTPSVLCSTTRRPAYTADTCGQCGRTQADCNSSACVFNPTTSLCRPQLTNKVRTASVHLNYPDPGPLVAGDASWWINRIEVVNSSSVSYFASNGHRFGYGGLQQVSAPAYPYGPPRFIGKVIFSLWDQGCDQDSNPRCDPSTLATIVTCGDDVTCEGFGGEGTGKKSSFTFDNWNLRSDYYFVTHARDVGAGRVRSQSNPASQPEPQPQPQPQL